MLLTEDPLQVNEIALAILNKERQHFSIKLVHYIQEF